MIDAGTFSATLIMRTMFKHFDVSRGGTLLTLIVRQVGGICREWMHDWQLGMWSAVEPKRSHELAYPCGATLWHDDLPLTVVIYYRHPRPLGDACKGCRLHDVMLEGDVEHCLGRVVLDDNGPVRRTRRAERVEGQEKLL